MTRAPFAPLAAAACLLASPVYAQLHPAPQVGERSPAEIQSGEYITSAVSSQSAGDPKSAFELASEAIRANPSEPWGYYMRAVALLATRRPDDAETEFKRAESLFPEADPWGKSVAIWGEANTFSEARPCRDAKALYERYAAFVAPYDSSAAAMGRAYAEKECKLPPPSAFTESDPGWQPYHQGDALLRARRYDEALAAYREAERLLPDAWGKSIAIWGQANALKEAGRCDEAASIYQRYAQFVQAHDPASAQMARTYAQRCLQGMRASEPAPTTTRYRRR